MAKPNKQIKHLNASISPSDNTKTAARKGYEEEEQSCSQGQSDIADTAKSTIAYTCNASISLLAKCSSEKCRLYCDSN